MSKRRVFSREFKIEARRAVFEYIEMFYNGIRRHSTPGYLSPAYNELIASWSGIETATLQDTRRELF